MTLLHDYLNTRNLQAFQRLLDGNSERGTSTSGPSSTGNPGPGSSYTGGGGKSWNRTGGVNTHSAASTCEVNVRDWLGRTALHLACTSLESIEYVRALLKNPHVDVNLADVESLWTPLHRALYAANFPVVLLLLQRPGIDTSLKDLEGYTAFDLYNSTVNGTKPDAKDVNAELFTWGTNRNASLGLNDGDDRTYPDHVTIKSKEDPATLEKMSLGVRFSPIHVRQIQMSRLHTAVVTAENEGNLRLCGFGSGGRLGPAQHTQYSLKPLPTLNVAVLSVALGQDHTLVLTKSGEVYSWGLNRFSQLGYVVEVSPTSNGRYEEPIQSVPKRVVGFLRKEVVRGVAASKNASACWTHDSVFTWGTNTGQLGYDKNAQPVQITPRPVTKFTHAVIDLAMSDTVLAALLVTHHVECIWNDRHYRISFPIHAFPTGIEPYRPPHSIKDSQISKVTCCDDTFAALSSNGEVFTFSAPSSLDTISGEGRAFKPQRVWALRKKFSAVKDVALGSDGSIIICTESGHVFVRTRNTKSQSGKAFKFERVPYIQRVTQVCANSTGAFGALRIDYEPASIEVNGNDISQDLKMVQPYLDFYLSRDMVEKACSTQAKDGGAPKLRRVRSHSVGDLGPSLHFDDEPEEDAGIEYDIDSVLELIEVLESEQRMRKAAGGNLNYSGVRLPHGADAVVHVQSGATFPVHRVVLASRSQVLGNILAGSKLQVGDHHQQQHHANNINNINNNINVRLLSARPGPGLGVFTVARVEFSGCHPLSVLILLRYLYSDELLAVWDRRVGSRIAKRLARVDANAVRVKAELQALATVLDLPTLAHALEAPGKREPAPSMAEDMERLFDVVQSTTTTTATATVTSSKTTTTTTPLTPDVVLQLADREVYCHSVILRARCPLFAGFFDLEDWTAKRWDADGRVRVDMKHFGWHVMRFVVRFMCCGADKEMFYVLDFVNSVEEVLHFMFEVLACANELLLDRLVLLCSSVILAHVNINNACFILSESTHYQVQPLIEKLQEYISVNMETFLESRLLDVDMVPYSLVKQLSKYVRGRQMEKAPYSRGGVFVGEAMRKYEGWIAEQDFPEPVVRSGGGGRGGFGGGGAVRREGSGSGGGGGVSPPTSAKKATQKLAMTTSSFGSLSNSNLSVAPQMSPSRGVLRRPPSGDDIFVMDVNEPPPPPPTATTLDNVPSSSLSLPLPMGVVPQALPPVWKAHGVPRVDMKAVMAEAAAATQASAARYPALSNSPRASTPRGAAVQNEPSTSVTPSKSSSKTPTPTAATALPLTWRTIPPDPNAALLRGVMLPSTPPTPSPRTAGSNLNSNSTSLRDTTPRKTTTSSTPSAKDSTSRPPPPNVVGPPPPLTKPQPLSPARSQQQLLVPGLGPVITPSRQVLSKPGSLSSNIRSASASGSGKAWTQTPTQPIIEPHSPTTATTTMGTKGMSFLAIQHSQQARQVVPPKDKRSLREIQEEEHALQAEADFLKWWTAEEERVQQEALALEEFQSNLLQKSVPAARVPSSSRKSPRNPKHNNKDKKDKGGESAGTQASTMQRVPSTAPDAGAGESSSASGRQQQPATTQPGNDRANHSPRKQVRKPRPKGSADS